jgi:alpha-galactosidase
MLEVGNGLTTAEERSHFAFWAMMKSPLIVGTDISLLSTDQLGLLENHYLPAFSQDSVYGAPATPFKWGINPDWTWNMTFPAEYWAGEFQNGTLIAMLNTLNNTVNKTAQFEEIPGMQTGSEYELTDIWTGNSLGRFENNDAASVNSHDTYIILAQIYN